MSGPFGRVPAGESGKVGLGAQPPQRAWRHVHEAAAQFVVLARQHRQPASHFQSEERR
ncbi:hypothetical protein MKI84_08450 [Ancylobacter sp. A5.8]|uniref:hypothetical protein n=1 Tax=Ancylobacter gelatini TaxID=2919920 RepID=UPI001F4E9100|nr:hypothetical protein [Ancylobacter gelatini]MCJ8142945.1 hypothetical protein [Ancylobacter gelatini]